MVGPQSRRQGKTRRGYNRFASDSLLLIVHWQESPSRFLSFVLGNHSAASQIPKTIPVGGRQMPGSVEVGCDSPADEPTEYRPVRHVTRPRKSEMFIAGSSSDNSTAGRCYADCRSLVDSNPEPLLIGRRRDILLIGLVLAIAIMRTIGGFESILRFYIKGKAQPR